MLGQQLMLQTNCVDKYNTKRVAMKVIHYTSSKNFKIQPIKIKNQSIKPIGGLWVSPVKSKYGWKEWCKGENFGRGKHKIYFDVDLSKLGIIIDSKEDLEKLMWKKERIMDRIEKTSIDFEKMKEVGIYYIYLTENGQDETRFSYPRSLYGWDCESLLILNEKCLK